MQARRIGLVRLSVVSIAGAFGACFVLWPCGDQKNGWPFCFGIGHDRRVVLWPEAGSRKARLLRRFSLSVRHEDMMMQPFMPRNPLLEDRRMNWTDLNFSRIGDARELLSFSSRVRNEILMVQRERVSRENELTLHCEKLASSMDWHWLEEAIRSALGPDVEVKLVGSMARFTTYPFGSDSDIDIQVRRRPGSDQADVPFTEADKYEVKKIMGKSRYAWASVTVHKVAIKFTFSYFYGTPVDLVLANRTFDDFPKLRGGKNLYKNSGRIYEFLKETPAARNVIVAVKRLFADSKPKGYLLETIVYRLSASFLLTKEYQILDLFFLVVVELWNWKEEGSLFGSDLLQDLDKLPETKRDEYIEGFERCRRKSVEDLCVTAFFLELYRQRRPYSYCYPTMSESNELGSADFFHRKGEPTS